jgi:hypothetical protein
MSLGLIDRPTEGARPVKPDTSFDQLHGAVARRRRDRTDVAGGGGLARILFACAFACAGVAALGTASSASAAAVPSAKGVAVAVTPTEVTCDHLGYSESAMTDTLASCNHGEITGGAGTFAQTAPPNPITETVTWANGETSVATEQVGELTGPLDKCAPQAHGIAVSREDKVKGTITGGTDTALIGGTLKRKTCVYQGSGTFFIRLFPGTVAKY